MNTPSSKRRQRATIISAATGVMALIVLTGWHTYRGIAGDPEIPIPASAVSFPLWVIAGVAFGICTGSFIDQRMQR